MNLAMLNSRYPRAPWEIQEAVELWAREQGRTAKMHMAPGGTWFVRLSLRCNDKRMLLYQQGFSAEPPGEDVWFHIPNPHEGKVIQGVRQGPYIPLDINQMGVSGVREFLDKGNTWSGRGEYLSLIDQLHKVRATNEEVRIKSRADAKEASRYEQREKRRFRFKIPFLRVGIDLKGTQGSEPAGDLRADDRASETE
ncbi:MAG: hypothetical protein NUW01_05120 [Gemmatimonadaceae bacterium]|nr:hypothetical protein [Gemmatimonadaceae bacterium]